ncbi:MAG: adenosine kinase [Alphaproteobacteria bacterium]|nr:adenosine kinase [Alphaproteobacteria bacterium]
MTESAVDVVGIGNAIVDVIANADDAFLARQGLDKGAMRLIDQPTAERLYGEMGPGLECSGGSAANSMVALASLGARSAYIGKVKDDELGRIFAHDIRASGVMFESRFAAHGAATARCLILVTPDAQRTMNTFLGASTDFGPGDLDAGLVGKASVTYLEGYLWDKPAAKDAFRQALQHAHKQGRKVALSLSDAFCVDRHRAEFRALVEHDIDILFANEAEIRSLYQVDDFDRALQHVRGHCEVAALTRSEKGSVVVRGEEIHVVDAAPVKRVVDTTGAGDFYAAGFLYGLTHKFDLARCARLGALAAAKVIGHFGARPETALKPLVEVSAKPLKR